MMGIRREIFRCYFEAGLLLPEGILNSGVSGSAMVGERLLRMVEFRNASGT